jgi:hypothetical protein
MMMAIEPKRSAPNIEVGVAMLQPKSYPEFVAKALVLDTEPFEAMTDDDNPWIEGLTFIVAIGLLAGLARAVGGALTVAALPPSGAALAAILQGWQQAAAALGISPAPVETVIGQAWQTAALAGGYTNPWSHLLSVIFTPMAAVVGWFILSAIVFAAAKALGGAGSFNGTLGAMSLIAAPQVLLFLTVVPFVAVSGALLAVWAALIAYRGVQVAHDLSWQRAAWATVIGYAVAAGLAVLLGVVFGLGIAAGGWL